MRTLGEVTKIKVPVIRSDVFKKGVLVRREKAVGRDIEKALALHRNEDSSYWREGILKIWKKGGGKGLHKRDFIAYEKSALAGLGETKATSLIGRQNLTRASLTHGDGVQLLEGQEKYMHEHGENSIPKRKRGSLAIEYRGHGAGKALMGESEDSFRKKSDEKKDVQAFKKSGKVPKNQKDGERILKA